MKNSRKHNSEETTMILKELLHQSLERGHFKMKVKTIKKCRCYAGSLIKKYLRINNYIDKSGTLVKQFHVDTLVKEFKLWVKARLARQKEERRLANIKFHHTLFTPTPNDDIGFNTKINKIIMEHNDNIISEYCKTKNTEDALYHQKKTGLDDNNTKTKWAGTIYESDWNIIKELKSRDYEVIITDKKTPDLSKLSDAELVYQLREICGYTAKVFKHTYQEI